MRTRNLLSCEVFAIVIFLCKIKVIFCNLELLDFSFSPQSILHLLLTLRRRQSTFV